MSGLGGLGGNVNLQQLFLWNTVSQLLGAALGPYMTALANEVNQATPLVPLSPADMADAVIRNIVTEGEGAHEASFAGVNADRFHQLTLLAGNAPDPTALAVALRRKFIDESRYLTGVRQGRLRDEWADLIRQLAIEQPSPAQALEAVVEAQLSPEDGRAKFAEFGGDPAQWDWLLGTVGSGPSPLEAATMAHRGLIPWNGTGLGVLSFDQAVAESHYRTKWTAAYRALSEYLPPPRTVTAMHRQGSLTTAEATTILQKHGVPPDLVAAYLHDSSAQKTARTKELAETTVLALYRDHVIARPEAAAFLERLAYTATEADYILQVEDLRMVERYLAAAIGRVHTLYTGHKIGEQAARDALSQLNLDAKQVDELVALWGHERAANVRTVTPSQIEAAYGYKIIDEPTALAMLEAEGYTPHDAWLVLSVHAKEALANEPPAGALTAPAGP